VPSSESRSVSFIFERIHGQSVVEISALNGRRVNGDKELAIDSATNAKRFSSFIGIARDRSSGRVPARMHTFQIEDCNNTRIVVRINSRLNSLAASRRDQRFFSRRASVRDGRWQREFEQKQTSATSAGQLSVASINSSRSIIFSKNANDSITRSLFLLPLPPPLSLSLSLSLLLSFSLSFSPAAVIFFFQARIFQYSLHFPRDVPRIDIPFRRELSDRRTVW